MIHSDDYIRYMKNDRDSHFKEWFDDDERSRIINDTIRIRVSIEYICGLVNVSAGKQQLEPLRLIALKALLKNIEIIIKHLVYDFIFNSKCHRVINIVDGVFHSIYENTRTMIIMLHIIYYSSEERRHKNINSIIIDTIKLFDSSRQFLLTESQIERFDKILIVDKQRCGGKCLDFRYVNITQTMSNVKLYNTSFKSLRRPRTK
jgi:hypothetical protein